MGPPCSGQGSQKTVWEFFRRLSEKRLEAATPQPSVGEFVAFYEKLRAQAEAIVSIHLAARFSGTLNSAQLAAQ